MAFIDVNCRLGKRTRRSSVNFCGVIGSPLRDKGRSSGVWMEPPGELPSLLQPRPPSANPLGPFPQAGVTALPAGGQPPANSRRSQARGRDTCSRNPKISLSEWGPERCGTRVRPGSRREVSVSRAGGELGAEVRAPPVERTSHRAANRKGFCRKGSKFKVPKKSTWGTGGGGPRGCGRGRGSKDLGRRWGGVCCVPVVTLGAGNGGCGMEVRVRLTLWAAN